MVKVGGYILGEFGNLIAGDPRSRSDNISKLQELYLQSCTAGILNSVSQNRHTDYIELLTVLSLEMNI